MISLCCLKLGPTKDVYALAVEGRCEVIDFIAELGPRAKKRLLYTIERLAETGWAGPGETVVKHLDAEVYEIKEHISNSRVFCFFEGRRAVVCTHARRKPAGKSRYRDEIDKVKSWRGRCIAEGILP